MTHPGPLSYFDLQRRAILERHARFVSLVTEELDAARRSDWGRVRELGAERALLVASGGDVVTPLARPRVRKVRVPHLRRDRPGSEPEVHSPTMPDEGAVHSRHPLGRVAPSRSGASPAAASDASAAPSIGLEQVTQESALTSRHLDPAGEGNRMTIRAGVPDPFPDPASRGAQPVGRRTDEENDAAAAGDRGDQVRISAETSEMAASTKGELTAERIAEVREKILSGAYNSLDVVDEVARRFLASGDL
jgi:anti-sigma28 factor (negative regulator of flagellin synthesis)